MRKNNNNKYYMRHWLTCSVLFSLLMLVPDVTMAQAPITRSNKGNNGQPEKTPTMGQRKRQNTAKKEKKNGTIGRANEVGFTTYASPRSSLNHKDSIRQERLKNASDDSRWGYDPAFLIYKDENDKYGYINRTGDIVIPCQWTYVHGFRDGLAIVVNEEKKKGYIDTKGHIVSPCQWVDIIIFREGLSPVKDDNGKWGAIDKEGKLVIPCIWNGMTSFGDGMTCVSKEISIDVYEERSSMFNGGRWVKKTVTRHGYIDKTGKEVLPFIWKSAMMFSEGLGAVQDDNGKWGFIDKKGQVVIPCQWKDTYSFTDGTASVKDENDVWHKIDKTGKIVKQ